MIGDILGVVRKPESLSDRKEKRQSERTLLLTVESRSAELVREFVRELI